MASPDHAAEPHKLEKIHKLRPVHRALFGLLFSAVVFCFLPAWMSALLHGLIVWVAFAAVYLVTSWAVIVATPVHGIKRVANREDGSKFFVFMMVLGSCIASMFAVLMLITTRHGGPAGDGTVVGVAVAAMLLSWGVVHTLYTFHYAHMYYQNTTGCGLEFPDDDEPDYLDFAYFAFCIGCTFQVSDVEISSKAIRRIALVHSLLAFGLNTFVVALTINIIASLRRL